MWRVSPPSAAREAAAWSAEKEREGRREGGKGEVSGFLP